MGARKIVVVNVGPIGCIPYQREINPSAGEGCAAFPNQLAQLFNGQLRGLVTELSANLQGSKFIYADVYRIVDDLIQNYSSYSKLHLINLNVIYIAICYLVIPFILLSILLISYHYVLQFLFADLFFCLYIHVYCFGYLIFFHCGSTTGFTNANSACCYVAGRFGGLIPCGPTSKVCADRSKFVFWDPYHPTDAANSFIAKRLLDGDSSNIWPMNIRQLIS